MSIIDIMSIRFAPLSTDSLCKNHDYTDPIEIPKPPKSDDDSNSETGDSSDSEVTFEQTCKTCGHVYRYEEL